ncbi:MAG: hypothetical protein U1C33_07440, partial [Candidatus Cloacimonadaceae bacterium]|nr:hypothetical protein [Candidatus Cloacimonadaceae bacterium]
MKAKASIVMLVFFILYFSLLSAQSEGDYRTFQSGDWHSFNTWEVLIGGEWYLASSIPVAATANVITIRAGHTVNVSNHITIDQTVVEADAHVVGAFDARIIVNDGDGDDLVVYGSLSTSGTSNQNSIGLSGSGKVIIFGDYYWQSGGITNTDLWIEPSGTMTLQGSAPKIMRAGAVINNQGSILHEDDSGNFMGVGNSVLNNLEGGLYHMMGAGNLRYEYSYDWYDMYAFNNYGTILKSATETTYTIFRGTFNNYGTIEIEEGSLQISGSGVYTSSGPMEIALGADFRLYNGAKFILNDDASINGGGVLLLDQSNTNQVLVVNASVPLAESITVDFINGTIGGNGTLNINGEFIYRGGRYEGPGMNLGSSAVLRICEGLEKRLCGSSVMNNYGQIIIEDSQTWHSNSGAVINNHIGGLIDFLSNGNILYRSDLGGAKTVLNNYGTLVKSAGTGTSSLNRIEFNNHEGAICQVQSGELRLVSYGEGTNSGSVLVNEACIFSIKENFDWTMAEGSMIDGFGTLLLDGGDILLSGNVDGASIGADIDFQMLSGSIGSTGKLNLLGDMLWSGGTLWCGNLIVSANSSV